MQAELYPSALLGGFQTLVHGAANWTNKKPSFLGSALPKACPGHDEMVNAKLGKPSLLNLGLLPGGNPETGNMRKGKENNKR